MILGKLATEDTLDVGMTARASPETTSLMAASTPALRPTSTS